LTITPNASNSITIDTEEGRYLITDGEFGLFVREANSLRMTVTIRKPASLDIDHEQSAYSVQIRREKP